MATVKGTAKTDKFTVNEINVIVVTGKKSSTEKISKKGKNRIFGADAKDTFTVKGGKHNYIYGDKGNDIITVTGKIGSSNKIYGDDAKNKVTGNDTFNINAGKKNYFYGGKGVDTFNVNGGTTNYLYGGAGKDTYIFGKKKATATIKDYAAGQDTLKVNSGVITSTTVKGKDVTFKAGKASVTVAGAAKKTISLKDSRGSYTVSNTAIKLGKDFTGTMDATKYVSTIKSIDARNVVKAVNIIGNSQANKILPGRGGGTYKCGAGNDTITIGGSAKYTIYGDAGDDEIISCGSGNGNTVYGNDGNDTIRVTGGKSVIDGGAGDDTINIGGGSSHIIYGGAGTDTFNHTSGTATIKDYAAGETLSFANAITGVTVDGQNITLTTGVNNRDVTVENGVGKLTQVTEAGKKKVFYVVTDGIFNLGDSNTDSIIVVKSSRGEETMINGDASNDVMYGDVSNDFLGGNAGNDVLYGGDGNDCLAGGDGDDNLYGGPGDDVMIGGPGSDVFYGGAGNNEMDAGRDDNARDTFVFGSDSLGMNEIYEFSAGTGENNDVIKLTEGVTISSGSGIDGSDVVATLSTGGTIRIVGCAGQIITVIQ